MNLVVVKQKDNGNNKMEDTIVLAQPFTAFFSVIIGYFFFFSFFLKDLREMQILIQKIFFLHKQIY